MSGGVLGSRGSRGPNHWEEAVMSNAAFLQAAVGFPGPARPLASMVSSVTGLACLVGLLLHVRALYLDLLNSSSDLLIW